MTESAQACAHAILEVVPPIVQALRVEMRAQRSHDLSVPQFRTLAYIRHHPCCSLSAVADFIGLTLPAMSTLVNGLVEKDLVSENDPQRHVPELTAKALLELVPGSSVSL